MLGFYVYILECSDGSYYTGWTTDPIRRLDEHNNSSKGSKYVRTRRPAKLVYLHDYPDKIEAMRAEWFIKHRMSRADKINLINSSMNQYK